MRITRCKLDSYFWKYIHFKPNKKLVRKMNRSLDKKRFYMLRVYKFEKHEIKKENIYNPN